MFTAMLSSEVAPAAGAGAAQWSMRMSAGRSSGRQSRPDSKHPSTAEIEVGQPQMHANDRWHWLTASVVTRSNDKGNHVEHTPTHTHRDTHNTGTLSKKGPALNIY